MAKGLRRYYKNPFVLGRIGPATQKALKDPYGGSQTGPRAKDMSRTRIRAPAR